MALQLVDKAGGGEVTLVSMAPNNEVSGLRTALAMGAAKGILVSDDSLKGADALDDRQGPGRRHQAGQPRPRAGRHRVHRRLHRHHAGPGRRAPRPAVGHLRQEHRRPTARVQVERQTEEGYDEVECPLPALVTVTAGVVEPRYPSFKGIMAAKGKPVEELKVADLGVTPSGVGGARQEITDVTAAEERQAGEIVEDEGDAHEKIVAFLEQLKVI